MHVSSLTNTRRVEGEAAEMFFPNSELNWGELPQSFFEVTVSCIVTNVHSSINPSLSFPSLLPRLPPPPTPPGEPGCLRSRRPSLIDSPIGSRR